MPEEEPDEPNRPPPPRRRTPPPLPTVDGASGKQIDVISKLLKDRILLLGTDVNDEMVSLDIIIKSKQTN